MAVDTFEAFYRDRWRRAVRLAMLLVGDLGIAEELAQDVFLGMRRNWATITAPDAYLRRSLANRAQNHRRRAGREVRVAQLDTDIGSTSAPELDELWALVVELPPRYRAALVLRFYEDLSEAAIADALGCRPGTVKSLIHRALATLREQL